MKRGVTTQQEIRAWFGPPLSIQTWGSGGSRWRYFHEETTQQDTATLRKFVRFIAALFGWRIFAPPVDVAYAKTVRHELEVFFDANGVVRDTVYKREEMPTRRVY